MGKPLTSVMEDYLETILQLNVEKKSVRVRDIARRLGVTMPTVTGMLKSLSDRGLVHHKKYEYVELSAEGTSIGLEMRRKHVILRRFLTDVLQIDFERADREACKMEHALSSSTLDNLVSFMEFIHECPRTGESWLQRFEEYRRHGGKPGKCPQETLKFSTQLLEGLFEKAEGSKP